MAHSKIVGNWRILLRQGPPYSRFEWRGVNGEETTAVVRRRIATEERLPTGSTPPKGRRAPRKRALRSECGCRVDLGADSHGFSMSDAEQANRAPCDTTRVTAIAGTDTPRPASGLFVLTGRCRQGSRDDRCCAVRRCRPCCHHHHQPPRGLQLAQL